MSFLLTIVKRLGYAVILLVAVLVLNFTLLHLAPGDAAETIAGESGGASKEMLEQIRKSYGLDRPFYEQLYIYLAKVAQGDLGKSFQYDQPVIDLILERVKPTLLLVVSSLFLAILFGTFLGVFAARRPNGLLSQAVTISMYSGTWPTAEPMPRSLMPWGQPKFSSTPSQPVSATRSRIARWVVASASTSSG